MIRLYDFTNLENGKVAINNNARTTGVKLDDTRKKAFQFVASKWFKCSKKFVLLILYHILH
jgi:hypothetical protein